MPISELQLEEDVLKKLESLKFSRREDIRDRAALEANFRQKFESLNRVTLTDAEFARLLDDIVTFIRDGGENRPRTCAKIDFAAPHRAMIHPDGHRTTKID